MSERVQNIYDSLKRARAVIDNRIPPSSPACEALDYLELAVSELTVLVDRLVEAHPKLRRSAKPVSLEKL